MRQAQAELQPHGPCPRGVGGLVCDKTDDPLNGVPALKLRVAGQAATALPLLPKPPQVPRAGVMDAGVRAKGLCPPTVSSAALSSPGLELPSTPDCSFNPRKAAMHFRLYLNAAPPPPTLSPTALGTAMWTACPGTRSVADWTSLGGAALT